MSQSGLNPLLQAAVTAQRAGRIDEARQHWQAVVAQDPGHAVALNALGAIALQHGEAETAAAMFDRAVAADPSSPDLLLNLAHAHRLREDATQERQALERGLAIAPQHLGISIRLAELLEREGGAVAATARWSVVLTIVQGMGSVPPGLQPVLAHARTFVAEQNARFADDIDAKLAKMRAAIPGNDRRRIDAAIDHLLGRRPIFLNQCSGLHIPFLPADEFFDRALLPWLPDLEAATPAIGQELIAALDEGGGVTDAFEPYVDLPAGIAGAQWAALDKSRNWSAIHLWRDGERNDAVCARFPITAALVDRLPLARLPRRMPTVFFSALAPRTHIPAHTGVTNARAIVHLPLIVPAGCRFRVGGDTREWHEGEAFAFDDTIEHEAWNDSDELRVVLIMDAWNPHLSAGERDIIRRFYDASEQDALAPTLAERRWLG